MAIRENALLLFAKLPEPGKVKTRLSVLKDGVFTPEDACRLFEAMLLDVAQICLDSFDMLCSSETCTGSLEDEYRLYISTAPASNAESMKKLFSKKDFPVERISFIGDSGASFDEHYNDAFEQVWEDGADCILSMGADMPALTVFDLTRGFDALHGLQDGGIVIAPDQEMGVSMVGWTRKTDFDHTGVYYNQTGLTVLPAYIEKAGRLGVPAVYLPPIPDVDTIADLAHNITLIEALEYTSAFDGNTPARRTADVLEDLGCMEVRVPPNELRDSRDDIDVLP